MQAKQNKYDQQPVYGLSVETTFEMFARSVFCFMFMKCCGFSSAYVQFKSLFIRRLHVTNANSKLMLNPFLYRRTKV